MAVVLSLPGGRALALRGARVGESASACVYLRLHRPTVGVGM